MVSGVHSFGKNGCLAGQMIMIIMRLIRSMMIRMVMMMMMMMTTWTTVINSNNHCVISCDNTSADPFLRGSMSEEHCFASIILEVLLAYGIKFALTFFLM